MVFELYGDSLEEDKTEYSEDLDEVNALIEDVLRNRFPNNQEKQQLDIYDNRYTFACPYCGDSLKHNNKKRGNFWFDTKMFICYNGDCNTVRGYKDFFKDMKSMDFLDYSKNIPNLLVKSVDSDNFVNNSLSSIYDFSNLCDKYGVTINTIKKIYNLREIYYDDELCSYLEDRCLTPDRKFLYSPKWRNIFILNIDNSTGKVISFQIRNFTGDNKYITIKLKKIYEKMKVDFDETNQELSFINKVSKFYNFTNIDTKKKIYVVEGSLDSLLLPNCMALCGISSVAPIDTKEVYYIMDYDKPGIKKSIELVDSKKNVFIWNKFLKDNGISISNDLEKIDITDLCKMGCSLKNIPAYFTKNFMDYSAW